MTSVGELWRDLSPEQQDRAAAALRGVLHETGVRLILAIDRAARQLAPAETEPRHADAYPYLFPADAAAVTAEHCYDCGAELKVEPIPYWIADERRRVYLGSSCWRDRMLGLAEKAAARHQALTLPIDHGEAG